MSHTITCAQPFTRLKLLTLKSLIDIHSHINFQKILRPGHSYSTAPAENAPANPHNKDASIEVYMSSLEEKLMKIEKPKDKYNNLTSKERQALLGLKNDKNIVIKGADEGSVVVVRDMEDYIKEAEK